MIDIHQVTLREIELSLREPFKISSGTQRQRRILLVEVTDGDGVSGWSECVAAESPNYLPETIDIAWVTLTKWIIPRALSSVFESPQNVFPSLQEGIRGHYMAKAAVEMAIWELGARREGQSLSRYLGGTRDEVATGISLGIQESEEVLVEKARAAWEEGYRKIKIKIMPGADVSFVRAVREALGPEAPVMVDANNAYRLEDLSVFKELDDLGLLMIEQPLDWDDHIRHRELQEHLKTPICLDESITTLERAQDMHTLRSGRIINIKPARVGGLFVSKAIHDFALEREIPVWCGGMLESGIGRAHNVALASLPGFVLPGDVSPSARYWERDIIDPEWTMNEGMVRVPVERAGMGVDVDVERVASLTVRQEVFSR